MFAKRLFRLLLAAVLLSCGLPLLAQEVSLKHLPPNLQRATVDKGDTIPLVQLREIVFYAPPRFKNRKEELQYARLVRDVKITLPYAQMVYNTLVETYLYMQTLPNDKAREKHLKQLEKDLYADYKPQLKKLTLSQGKLLIKLIDRQCHQSSYHILKAYLGSFRAGFWNFFAGMFGASLKTQYDPHGKDAMTERVVIQVEEGAL
jgi:hypothetical protein